MLSSHSHAGCTPFSHNHAFEAPRIESQSAATGGRPINAAYSTAASEAAGASSRTSESRGELCDDDCFAVDLSPLLSEVLDGTDIQSACWSEANMTTSTLLLASTPTGTSRTEAISLVFSDVNSIRSNQSQGGPKKKKKRAKAITVVVPVDFSAVDLADVFTAASAHGLTVKNIFEKSLAGIAYQLRAEAAARPADRVLSKALQQHPHSAPSVIFVDSSASKLRMSLVGCEKSQVSSTSSLVAADGAVVDRLVCVSSASVTVRPKGKKGQDWDLNAKTEEIVTAVGRKYFAHGAVVVLSPSATSLLGETGCLHLVSILSGLSPIGANSFVSEGCIAAGGGGLPVIKIRDEDAFAIGACLLSAAELTSSKKYIDQPDGSCAIAYMLPVGDSRLCANIGIKIVAKGSTTSNDEVQTLFTAGTRILKAEHGFIRPLLSAECAAGSTMVSMVVGKTGIDSKTRSCEKIVVMHRRSDDAVWQQLQELRPLGTGPDAIESCSVNFSLNPHTAALRVELTPGQRVTESSSSRQQQLVIVGIVFLVLIALLAWYGYGLWAEYSMQRSDEEWLLNFYSVHAPSKIAADPDLVRRTIKKYRGKMLILWRQLERTYSVKWAPPDSASAEL